MGTDQQAQKAIEYIEMLGMRIFIAELAWTIIGTLIFFGLLYLTLRYAIRDGLRDAQRTERRIVTRTSTANLPDMRAD